MNIRFKTHTFLGVWVGNTISRYTIVLMENNILGNVKSITKIDKHSSKITFENNDYTAEPVDNNDFEVVV